MAKGRIIKDHVRQLIAQVYRERPKWRAEDIMNEVHKLSGMKSPRLSAVQKELAKIRNRDTERRPSPLDQPWSMGSLNNYNLPAYLLPRLVKIQMQKHENSDPLLTIREARWVARLHAFTENDKLLAAWARWYTFRELVSEDTDTDFDSFDFDIGLETNSLPFSYATWMSLTELIPESDKKEFGEIFAHQLEKQLLGQELHGAPLTGFSWWRYNLYLGILNKSSKWVQLSTEERSALIMKLQDWVYNHQDEQNENILSEPTEILEEVDLEFKHGYISEKEVDK